MAHVKTKANVVHEPAIQEFKEQTATYSAEYGSSANQINIISNSGTNDWKRWDGTPKGYEGLLVDGYMTLMSVLSRPATQTK